MGLEQIVLCVFSQQFRTGYYIYSSETHKNGKCYSFHVRTFWILNSATSERFDVTFFRGRGDIPRIPLPLEIPTSEGFGMMRNTMRNQPRLENYIRCLAVSRVGLVTMISGYPKVITSKATATALK